MFPLSCIVIHSRTLQLCTNQSEKKLMVFPTTEVQVYIYFFDLAYICRPVSPLLVVCENSSSSSHSLRVEKKDGCFCRLPSWQRFEEVTGSNSVEALIFSGLFFPIAWKIYCNDHSSLWYTTAVQTFDFFHILRIEFCFQFWFIGWIICICCDCTARCDNCRFPFCGIPLKTAIHVWQLLHE